MGKSCKPETPAKTWHFTRISCLVVIVSWFVCGGLLSMAVRSAREAANASACKNNLRQLALAAQNHSDQRGDLPPLGIYSGGASWAGLLAAYVDASCLAFMPRFDLPYDAPENTGKPEQSPFFVCASRRRVQWDRVGYPLSDYAVPILGVDVALDNPRLDDTWMQCHNLEKNHGPFLLVYRHQPEEWKARNSAATAMRYRSQTSLASFVDGPANQVIFGEKALYPSALDRDGKAGDFTVCSFIENNYNASGAARPGNGGIAPSAYDHEGEVYRYWGSWHPGTCQFAMASGEVRQINVGISAKALASLCDRCDVANPRRSE